MKQWIFLVVLGCAVSITAQTPNSAVLVGAVGTMQGGYHLNPNKQSDDQIGFNELELTIQGKVYPDVDATLIVAIHPEDGQFATEVENGFVEFSSLMDGVGASIGRQFVPFGKQNKLHPEQQAMIDRPAVVSQFFGAENLAADGIALNAILPLPFFCRLELGHWKNTLAGTPADLPFSPTGYLSTGRLWSSVELSDSAEAELGFSGLQGFGPEYATQRDDATIIGTDLTFRQFLGSKSRIMVQGELIQLNRNVDGISAARSGGFLLANYRTETGFEIGVRYDHSERADIGDPALDRRLSLNLMQKFSETYFGRVEYIHDLETDSPAIYGQLVFNLGSHTHALQ